jgi:hypothetical protein
MNLHHRNFVDSYDELATWAPEDISTHAHLCKGSVTIESVRLVKGEGPVEVE